MRMMMATSNRLIVVSGASRGVGVGICSQLLKQDPTAQVVVTARVQQQAAAVATQLGDRCHPLQCDVTNDASCEALVAALGPINDRPFTLVNNAGVAHDLPWFPSPWPASAASSTLAVNLFGAERLTRALLPRMLASSDGRVVFVSSGAGRANMKKMDAENRARLLSGGLKWEDVAELAARFTSEYEAAATAQASGAQLPYLSPSGLWLQSYGFSKACLGALCAILSRAHPSLLSVACTPGFVRTDMSNTYTGQSKLKTIEEGGETPAWLACCADRAILESGSFYQPDHVKVDWEAD